MARVDSEGRVVLPENVREELGIEPGTEVDLTEEDGAIVITPRNHPEKILKRVERLVNEAVAERETREEVTDGETKENDWASLDEISPQADEFKEDVHRGAQHADDTETDDGS